MNIQYIHAQANQFQEKDKRLSRELALTEAILYQVIIELDNKGLIPQSRIVDNSKR